MNRKEAKELMPIIQAFAEGKTIQYYDSLIDIADWEDCENPNFENLTYKFRIKPEPTYRPFKDAEECWKEMQKHHPIGWVKLKDTESGYYMLKGIASQVVIGFNETPFSYKRVFEDYTFADELTFGIKVEEE